MDRATSRYPSYRSPVCPWSACVSAAVCTSAGGCRRFPSQCWPFSSVVCCRRGLTLCCWRMQSKHGLAFESSRSTFSRNAGVCASPVMVVWVSGRACTALRQLLLFEVFLVPSCWGPGASASNAVHANDPHAYTHYSHTAYPSPVRTGTYPSLTYTSFPTQLVFPSPFACCFVIVSKYTLNHLSLQPYTVSHSVPELQQCLHYLLNLLPQQR